MVRPAVRRTHLLAGLAACAISLGACAASPVTGTGTVSRASTRPDFPTSTAAPSTRTTAPAATSTVAQPSSPVSVVTPSPITVTGTTSQHVYQAEVFASDDITDCAAHAYGSKMVAFLHAHRCGPTHRTLALVDMAGQQVVVSSIATSFRGTAKDPYAAATTFQKLELADGTGSINDLLREGRSIPGVATRIPAHEAFQVVGQDSGVDVFDAWYATGQTRDQDRTLLNLEQDLFLTPLVSGG